LSSLRMNGISHLIVPNYKMGITISQYSQQIQEAIQIILLLKIFILIIPLLMLLLSKNTYM